MRSFCLSILLILCFIDSKHMEFGTLLYTKPWCWLFIVNGNIEVCNLNNPTVLCNYITESLMAFQLH